MIVSKKEIMRMMEGLAAGEHLVFGLPQTFGGGVATIELNGLYPQKGQKRFVLRVGKDQENARDSKPFWSTDKTKHLAGWVTDRLGDFIEGPVRFKGAA
jgi:hypothetical protein